MKTELCDRFGIEYPIFVFTPSEKVAAAARMRWKRSRANWRRTRPAS